MIVIINKGILKTKVRRDSSLQPYYYVNVPKFGGGRSRRFFARTPEGKREAETFLQLIKTQRENEGMEAFSIPQELRIEALKCQRLLEPASTTLTDAVQFFLKHAKPAGGTKSVADAIKEFLASKRKAGRRESYVRNLEFVLNCFKRDFQNQNVNDISRDGIESWLDRFNNLTSRKNRIRDLSVLFEFCRRRGYCGSNPLQNIERPTITRRRPEIFSVSETTALLTTAELHKELQLVPVIAIGLFAGLRIEEIKKLDWRNVHLEEKEIDVDENVAKTRQQRSVEMCDSLVAWLIPHRRNAGPVMPKGFRNRKDKLLTLAGVTTWSRNALRHSFGSYHCAHSQNPNMTAFQMGHGTTDTLFKYYRNYRISKKDAEAYWKIAPASSGNKLVAFSSATA
jgi:integrase